MQVQHKVIWIHCILWTEARSGPVFSSNMWKMLKIPFLISPANTGLEWSQHNNVFVSSDANTVMQC